MRTGACVRLLTGPASKPDKKPWTRQPSLRGQLASGLAAITSGAPYPSGVNPQDLLNLLRSGYDVRKAGPVSGTGWTGTRYVFTRKPSKSGAPAVVMGIPGLFWAGFPASVTGTVDVDSHGRVRRFSEAAEPTAEQRQHKPPYRVEMTFGDFGTRVSVSPPPASQTRDIPPARPARGPRG